MARFEKERNIIKFYLTDDDRHYDFDIDKGVLYGLKGSPLKRNPAGVIDFMNQHSRESNLLMFMYRQHSWQSRSYVNMRNVVKYLQICDKLDSIGYHPDNHWNVPSNSALDFVNDNFKAFVKFIKENPSGTVDGFVRAYRVDKWLKDHKLKLDDYFTREMAESLIGFSEWNDKKIGCAIFYLKRGLQEVFTSYGSALNLLNEYFTYCDRLECEYVRGDFVREFATTKKNYEFRKTELDNKALCENQMKYENALAFESADLKVVIPTTSAEFIEEGENQSNCVARLYLPKVVKGTTNVVFIRRKNNPTNSYITCEVCNGEIVQYLTRFNNRVQSETALAFKRAYQEHLHETWGQF